MSYCHNCGEEIKPEQNFCPSCGKKLETNRISPDDQGYRDEYNERKDSHQNDTEYGLWSLILGLVGLFLFGIVLGPIAIYLGYKGRKSPGEEDTKGTIGIVLGIITTITYLIFLIWILTFYRAAFMPIP